MAEIERRSSTTRLATSVVAQSLEDRGSGAARWTSRLLTAAEGKFGLLLVALVALMGAAPLLPNPVTEAVLTLFTGAVLVASLHASRPGGKPVAFGSLSPWRTS